MRYKTSVEQFKKRQTDELRQTIICNYKYICISLNVCMYLYLSQLIYSHIFLSPSHAVSQFISMYDSLYHHCPYFAQNVIFALVTTVVRMLVELVNLTFMVMSEIRPKHRGHNRLCLCRYFSVFLLCLSLSFLVGDGVQRACCMF